jgi:hypothetical protein
MVLLQKRMYSYKPTDTGPDVVAPVGPVPDSTKNRVVPVPLNVPVGPVTPKDPVGPVRPVNVPGSPVGPLSPMTPVGPVGPVGPVEPCGPVGPVGPRTKQAGFGLHGGARIGLLEHGVGAQFAEGGTRHVGGGAGKMGLHVP